MIFDPAHGIEKRFFAFLELVCFPMSILTLFALVVQVCLLHTGYIGESSLPGWWKNIVLPILLSAAIGYITNWIAIEMLFKPYQKTWKHPFAWFTCGYWRQGLIPKNKASIAEKAGEMVEQKLLDPSLMAKKVCGLVINFIHDKTLIQSLRDMAQKLLLEKSDELVEFITPVVEKSLGAAIDRMVTADSIQMLWKNEIEPQWTAPENRQFIANNVVKILQGRSPQLVIMLKTELREMTADYLAQKLGFLQKLPGFLGDFPVLTSDALADGLVTVINWDSIERRLCEKIAEPKTMDLIRDEVLNISERVRVYFLSPEGHLKVEAFLDAKVRKKLKEFLRSYIQQIIPVMLDKAATSQEFWEGLEKLLLSSEENIREVIYKIVVPRVQKGLDIRGEVVKAIHQQDVRQFHEMISSIAAQHLGAIQVLGYLLGAAIGAIQIFAK